MTRNLGERALLASLPLLGLVGSAGNGLAYGALGGSLLLAATVIFLGIRSVLPRGVHRLSFFLLLFVTTVILAEIFSLSLLLGVCLSFLALPDLFTKYGNWKRIAMKTIGASFFFWAFLTGQGILTDFARLTGSVGFFQFPTGSFLLAGLVFSLFPRERAAR